MRRAEAVAAAFTPFSWERHKGRNQLLAHRLLAERPAWACRYPAFAEPAAEIGRCLGGRRIGLGRTWAMHPQPGPEKCTESQPASFGAAAIASHLKPQYT